MKPIDHLFTDCEACEGRGFNILDSGWAGFECEDCDGTGKTSIIKGDANAE